MDKLYIFNLPFNIAPYETFIDEIIRSGKEYPFSKYVCLANVHMLIETYKNDEFAKQVSNADIVTPDGIPITWALRMLHGVKQDRVAGMDLLPDLLSRAELEHMPVYFYGGTEEILKRTEAYVEEKFPNLILAGKYSPPFHLLSYTQEEVIIENINSSGARLVFVVLGCPKQEKWMANMKGRIKATMIGIGGALPVLIGMQKRAPVWMQKSGLEWFYRLIQDPKRLWKRYFVTNSIFIYLLTLDKIKGLFVKKNSLYKNKRSI